MVRKWKSSYINLPVIIDNRDSDNTVRHGV
jgi:hypothetical protein